MAKAFLPQVLTANRLHEGDVVYWTGETWSNRLGQAQVAHTPEDAAAFEELGLEEETRCQIISPYIFPVECTGEGTITPLSRREHIRANGPSVPFGSSVARARIAAEG